ncbi:hypothetical protein D9600_15110 [Deinococcus sp. DB0503]|nr:hypothetical protein [Deinococcus sp. DB0503]
MMPRKRPNPAQACHDLSRQRLSAYAGATDQEKLTQYAKNVKLSEALYPVLQTLEVVLRNRVEEALQGQFGSAWYSAPDFQALVTPRTWDTVQKAIRDLDARRRTVSSGAVVAELSFGFWTHLFIGRYETGFYTPNVGVLLPYAPPSRRSRAYVQRELDMVRRLRNRVFHHEPILNRPTLLQDYARILSRGQKWRGSRETRVQAHGWAWSARREGHPGHV